MRLYRTSALDAVVTYEPIRTRLIDDGARELFSTRDIPGEIIDVLVTSRTDAEFVESAEILATLTVLGVDYAQGYGIHRPSPLASLVEPVGSALMDRRDRRTSAT